MSSTPLSGFSSLWQLVTLPFRYHFWGSFAVVLVVCFVISGQMSDRHNFADGELHADVMERWGAPIRQPSPSVRYVPSGTVFTSLSVLPLERQEVSIDSAMNYRKRGLVYFSGFDFIFHGQYQVLNTEKTDIDAVFVFPIELQKNQTLLSELKFIVNGKADLATVSESDKLLWTGRIKSGETVDFDVSFRGRGLDSFTYVLDPQASVRNFHLGYHISGGANFDYSDGVVSAHETRTKDSEAWLDWRYTSLESGIPVGVILPSEKSFDVLVATMVRRAWAPFLLLFATIAALSVVARRQLLFYEMYLLAAGYGLFFVLLAYFGAFLNFYLAWTLSLTLVGSMLLLFLKRLLPSQPMSRLALPLIATLATPTVAVMLQGYTGLIYTLEIAVLVATLMFLTTKDTFRTALAQLLSPSSTGAAHA